MNFNFSEAANSQNTTPKTLEANQIHEVTFEGCVSRDFAGVQDPTRSFKVLDIKFSNKDGVFTHTVWQPRDSDFEDTQGSFGPQPAIALCDMYLFKHLIDAVNPEAAAKINTGEIKMEFTPDNWDQVRKFMVSQTDPGKGTKTKIKLVKNNKGETTFPSFFLNYNRDGELYMSTNFIGTGVYFTTKELEKIAKSVTAKPTTVTNTSSLEVDTEEDDFDDKI